MAERPKRRRLADPDGPSSTKSCSDAFAEDPSVPATAEDRVRWKGFCEIESDPAFFNVMLRDFGVKDVRVQEVVSLDPDMLGLLYRPIYGLIFLYRWREQDMDKQELSCPEDIWFANQTVNNACASVALLNIVNNVAELELGDNLEHFKRFTANFTPALRGDAVGNFEFVKTIHNSFARKMDMLNADLQLKNDASSRKKSKANSSDEDDAGFHFIAFVPVHGNVWKLDGLERQPQNLGSITSDDWVVQVAPEIESRMAQYEEGQIEFSIMSLAKEPLSELVTALAQNVKSINFLSQHLDQVKPGWTDFLSEPTYSDNATNSDTILGPCEQYELRQTSIDQVKLCSKIQTQLTSDKVEELLAFRQELVTAQAGLRASFRDEAKAIKADNERATSRRNDKGQLAKGLLQVLGRMDHARISTSSWSQGSQGPCPIAENKRKIMDREADPYTQLMVDEAILDYLLYTAIKALLNDRTTSASTDDSVHPLLHMVNSFLSVFHALHPDHQSPAELRFRLRLLQFIYAFKQRPHHLHIVSSASTRKPLHGSHVETGKLDTTSDTCGEQEGSIDLRETLPLFLALSAAQNALQESTITELWMRLAAGYMAQVYAEQVLTFQNNRPGLLEEIFHLGFDSSCAAEEESDEWKINDMFDTDDGVTSVWEDVKEEHMSALRPPTGTTLTAHLKAMVSGDLSISTFEDKVSEFLAGLLSAHPLPVLTQLEGGKVDGLSRTATALLKRRAGFT